MGRIFASVIWGVCWAYFREGLFLGGLIIGILRYSTESIRWVYPCLSTVIECIESLTSSFRSICCSSS